MTRLVWDKPNMMQIILFHSNRHLNAMPEAASCLIPKTPKTKEESENVFKS